MTRGTPDTGALERDLGDKLGRLRQAGDGKLDAARYNYARALFALLAGTPAESRAQLLLRARGQFNGSLGDEDWIAVQDRLTLLAVETAEELLRERAGRESS